MKSITKLGNLAVVLVMVVMFAGVAPIAAHASDSWGPDYFGGFDSWDTYTSDAGWDPYGSDAGWDSYSYDAGWDSYNQEVGWDPYGSNGYYEENSHPYGYSEDSSYPYGYSEDAAYPYSYNEDASYPYGYSEDASYPYGYGVYYDDECACYSYGSYGGGVTGRSATYGYSSGGYSMVKPMTFGTPSYPTYNPPAKSTGGSSSVSNISNTTITNVDNSIRDSFNNYNSNNVSYVAPATPQYPVVHVQPGPYCQIYQTQATGSGVTAVYLSWTSSNATSAYLSNVGGVSVNGSKTVWPTGSQNYTLTVYGYNGQTATCYTNVNAAPYVSLTQIPYTGFDFGTFGNAMYWAGLATFALGAGYLAIYYVPALAIAGTRSRKEYAPVVAPKAPILVERGAAAEKLAPIVNSVRKAGTFDTMAILASKDGSMPKIVIDRS